MFKSSRPDDSSRIVVLWLFLGFYWFNRKVEFSLFIAQLVTTSFAAVTWRVQILLPVWHGEPRPKSDLDDLSNSGPAGRLDSEGWELGPPEDRYIKGGILSYLRETYAEV